MHMLEKPFNHSQAFQQAIATTVTCRTLIKYNSNLSNEQKEEILGDIETTLAFLGKRLEMNTSIESNTALSPEKLADLLLSDIEIGGEEKEVAPQAEHELSLRHLHRLYRTYLSNEPDKGIAALEARYKTVMNLLDRLQELAELRRDATANDLTVDELLSRIRGFVTALYCMFREFASLFSKVIEGQSIDIDTEAMALLQGYPHDEMQQLVRDITPLVYLYDKQRQAQQQTGLLRENVRDAQAFLIFLQECLGQTFARRQEIVSQIKSTANLLNELSALLTDYELTVAQIIMQSPSRSR
jgi:hypothetical protein